VPVRALRPPHRPIPVRALAALLALTPWILAGGAVAAQGPSDPARQLMEEERVRAAVDDALELVESQPKSAADEVDHLVRAADSMVATGPAAIPYLVDELRQALVQSFFFAAYSLGRIGGAEAESALLEALDRADAERGPFAQQRKGWSAYCLGLLGRADAIARVNQGRHLMGQLPIQGDLSALESIAIQTGDAAVPIILAELERLAKMEGAPSQIQRVHLVHALRRLAPERALPVLLKLFADDPYENIRREAGLALGVYRAPEAVSALVAALGDDSTDVRKASLLALDEIRPDGVLEPVVARLPVEPDVPVRGLLYRLVAHLGGPAALEPLAAQAWRADPQDRTQLVRALGECGTTAAVPTLVAALDDPDNGVAVQALASLAEVDAPEARAALRDAVDSPRWPLALDAVQRAVQIDDVATGQRILKRLLTRHLERDIPSPAERYNAGLLLDAAEALRATGSEEALRQAAARQSDGGLRERIERAARNLTLLRTNGRKVKKWIGLLDSDDAGLRHLTYTELGRLGQAAAAAPLAERFGRVDAEEGLDLLRALAHVDAPPSHELVRRVLLDPAFDEPERQALRDMAAWAARKLGGEDMVDALAQAVARRDGRDGRVLAYLIVLDPRRGLSVLERYRITRMRYLIWSLGWEWTRFEALRRDGPLPRLLARLDVPPERLDFR